MAVGVQETVSNDRLASLRLGDHACGSYVTDGERRDTVVAFARAGVAAGQQVRCFVDAVDGAPAALTAWLATDVPAAAPGQVRVHGVTATGPIDPDALLDRLATGIARAREDGYPGVRLLGDMAWTLRGSDGIDALAAYEAQANRLFGDGRATGLCLYDLRKFELGWYRAALAAHPGTIDGTGDAPTFTFTFTPRGVSLAGDVDAANGRAFAAVLGRLSTMDGRIMVDATGLRFLDVAGAGAVLGCVTGRVGPSVVRCRGRVEKTLRLAGAARVPNLRLERVADD